MHLTLSSPGRALCMMVNRIRPGAVPRINRMVSTSTLPLHLKSFAQHRCNIALPSCSTIHPEVPLTNSLQQVSAPVMACENIGASPPLLHPMPIPERCVRVLYRGVPEGLPGPGPSCQPPFRTTGLLLTLLLTLLGTSLPHHVYSAHPVLLALVAHTGGRVQ